MIEIIRTLITGHPRCKSCGSGNTSVSTVAVNSHSCGKTNNMTQIEQSKELIKGVKSEYNRHIHGWQHKAAIDYTASQMQKVLDIFLSEDKINFTKEQNQIIKDLRHFKDTTIGLYATDKDPELLFEEIFVHLIEKIGMDGEKTFSAMDYDYYREYFNKGINLLMWRIS